LRWAFVDLVDFLPPCGCFIVFWNGFCKYQLSCMINPTSLDFGSGCKILLHQQVEVPVQSLRHLSGWSWMLPKSSTNKCTGD
jgi:hypothetical protein